MSVRASIPLLAAAFLLSACGTNRADRALGGAALGAGTGAAVGAAFGGIAVVPGALIGAGVGAAGGLVTDANDINLGKPIWR